MGPQARWQKRWLASTKAVAEKLGRSQNGWRAVGHGGCSKRTLSAEGGGGWHEASVLGCLPLAAPIGASPLLILTLCGSERVLVVSMKPPDDLSCLTTPGVGRPGDGAVARAVDHLNPDAHSESMRGFADSSPDLCALGCASAGSCSWQGLRGGGFILFKHKPGRRDAPDFHGMRLGVDDPLVQIQFVIIREQKEQVLEGLRQPKALHQIVLLGRHAVHVLEAAVPATATQQRAAPDTPTCPTRPAALLGNRRPMQALVEPAGAQPLEVNTAVVGGRTTVDQMAVVDHPTAVLGPANDCRVRQGFF